MEESQKDLTGLPQFLLELALSVVFGVVDTFSSSGGWFLGTNYYEQDNFVTVGIPVEGQLFWIPLNFLGIGLYGFANLNTEKSFIGALLCIQLGKLR